MNNEKYNIIESEFNYNYDTFQKLNINENKKVYFETKENIEENNNSKIKNKLLFDLYKKIGLIKINNIFYLLVTGDEYTLFINKKTKIEDVISKLKKKYGIINSMKYINLCNEDIYLNEQFNSKTIEQLNIKDYEIILTYI